MMIGIIAVLVLLVFVLPSMVIKHILPGMAIKHKHSPFIVESVTWLIGFSGKKLPFSSTSYSGVGGGVIYSAHPFTNWSLNPGSRNKFGERIHTLEGFRKTVPQDSIMDILKLYPEKDRIVCIGGSTTYCTEIERYQDTWPGKLNERLKDQNYLVLNLGVGGWGTTQSISRCVSWLPIIKPRLAILYQAKNDLTPVFNGAKSEKEIFPDFQNVMGQFSELFSLSLPRWFYKIPLLKLLEIRKFVRNYSLTSLYNRPKRWGEPPALGRFDDKLLEGILFRTELIIKMCDMLGTKIIYIPELVRDQTYGKRLDRIYKEISLLLTRHKNATFLDLKDVLPDSDEYFLDKMHFNVKGCELFARILEREIVKCLQQKMPLAV